MKIANVSKKMLALLMAMLMMFSCMAVVANAAATITITEADYELNADKDAITVNKIEYNGKVAKITISPSDSIEVLPLADGRTRFDGIKTGKTYVITATVSEGDAIIALGNIPVVIKNAQKAPANPVPTQITSTSIAVSAISGCQYQLSVYNEDGTTTVEYPWSDSKGNAVIKYTGLTPNAKYLVEAKKAETDTYYASPIASIVVITKEAGNLNVPNLYLEDKTNKTVTLGSTDKNVEYSRDGKTWQDSPEFKGLTANTQYSFFARFKYNESNEDPSIVSNAIVVKTNAKENVLAQRKNITFVGKEGQFVNEGVEFTVKGDGPASMSNVIYGDTRIIPKSYSVTYGTTPVATGGWETAKLSQKGTFTAADDFAGKKVKVSVMFATQEYKGKFENGTPNWVNTEYFVQDFEMELGKVNNLSTQIGSFFEAIGNFFLNTLPGFLAEAMQSDIWGRLLKVFGNLGKALG